MKLSRLLIENGLGEESNADHIYNTLLSFFAEHQNSGQRFKHAYEVWKEYKPAIKRQIISAISFKDLKEQAEEKPLFLDFTYAEQTQRFYGLYISSRDTKKQREKISGIVPANEYLKTLGVTTDLPETYDTEVLNDIVKQLDDLGIDAEYADYFDIS